MRSWTFGGEAIGDLEKIHAPDISDIESAARHLRIDRSQMLRTEVFRTDAKGPALSSGVDPKWVVAVVRGDHRIDIDRLAAAVLENFHVGIPASTEDEELRAKWPIGFVAPDAAMRAADAVLVVDPDAAQDGFWAAGGNEAGWYVKYFNWFRECGDRLADPKKTAVAEIRGEEI